MNKDEYHTSYVAYKSHFGKSTNKSTLAFLTANLSDSQVYTNEHHDDLFNPRVEPYCLLKLFEAVG